MEARGALIGCLARRWAEQLGDGQPAKELSLAPEPQRGQPGLQLPASLSASQARCAQVLPDSAAQPSAATFVDIWEGVRGASLERNRCVRVSAPVSGSFPCSQAGSGSLGRGGGRFWPVLPPHAPPRGPDSGVRGRTGDARPVYPPRAASAPTGGAARAREGEGSPPELGLCDLPRGAPP